MNPALLALALTLMVHLVAAVILVAHLLRARDGQTADGPPPDSEGGGGGGPDVPPPAPAPGGGDIPLDDAAPPRTRARPGDPLTVERRPRMGRPVREPPGREPQRTRVS